MLRFPQPLIAARFVKRPNRFVIRALVDDKPVSVRCPSPGSLRELLFPGVELRVYEPTGQNAAKRRTDYTLALIRHGRHWVSIDTQLPNRLLADHLTHGRIPQFSDSLEYETEIPFGTSRLDFLLHRKRGKPRLVEVKCCNLVSDRVALFPDSVSSRATRHVRELIDAKSAGYEPWVVFLITRRDLDRCAPFREADPAFAEAMAEALRAKVKVLALTHKVTLKAISLDREVPFSL